MVKILWKVILYQTSYFKYSSSVQSLSRVQLFLTPWIAARQASLSITNSRSSLRLTSIESVMPSSHLILCRPLLLLPPVPPSNRVFSSESTLRMRWLKYWSFSFSIIPSKEIPGLVEACLNGMTSWGRLAPCRVSAKLWLHKKKNPKNKKRVCMVCALGHWVIVSDSLRTHGL